MKQISILRHQYPCTSTPERRDDGKRFLEVILNTDWPPNSPESFIKATVNLPAGTNFFKALRQMEAKNFTDDLTDGFVRIPSPMLREKKGERYGIKTAILVPNVWRHLSPEAIDAFLRSDEENLLTNFIKQSGNDYQKLTWKRFCDAIDATLLKSGFSPAEISAINFIFTSPQPEGVSRPEVNKDDNTSWKGLYPEASKLIAQYTASIAKIEAPKDEIFVGLDVDSMNTSVEDKEVVKILIFYALKYVNNPMAFCGEKKPNDRRKNVLQASSKLTIMRKIPAAYRVLKNGEQKVKITGGLREAAHIVRSSQILSYEAINSGKILTLPREEFIGERPFLTPFEIASLYGLQSPPPSLPNFGRGENTLQNLTLRMFSIVLIHGWQRARSLMDIEIQHIKVSKNFVEIIIPDTKTGRVDMRIPLWALCPNSELSFIRAYKEWVINQKDVNSKTRLTTLSLGKIYPKGASSTMQTDIKVFMHDKDFLDDEGTHLARVTGLSWAPIRALLSHNPQLRSHPILENVIDHPWFAEENLSKFKILVPGMTTDAAEIFRRIACWTSTHELLHSYCRSWHIITTLRLALNKR